MTDSVTPQLVAGGTEAKVCCPWQKRKILVRITWQGLHLWCRGCSEEHLLPRAALLEAFRQFLRHESGDSEAIAGTIAVLTTLR